MASKQENSTVKIASEKPGIGRFELVVVNGEVQYVEATPEGANGHIVFSSDYKLILGLVEFIEEVKGDVKSLQIKKQRDSFNNTTIP
jgi:hypothetical protein